MSLLQDRQERWRLGFSQADGLNSLGLDSEGTGRQVVNLLRNPARVAWENAEQVEVAWSGADDKWTGVCRQAGRTALTCEISQDGDGFVWRLTAGDAPVVNLRVELPFNPLITPVTALPAGLDAENRGTGPWLLVAPDFGHLKIEAEGPLPVVSVLEGQRGGGGGKVGVPGASPVQRGEQWPEIEQQRKKQARIALVLRAEGTLAAGQSLTLRFSTPELTIPSGVDPALWKRVRRAYLNNWQPVSTSVAYLNYFRKPTLTHLLANNALSDPAAISLMYYSEPMLFWHEPVPGISVLPLLRHSLDYYLKHQVEFDGRVNAVFERGFELYLVSCPTLITAAWHYWTLTHDDAWLKGHIATLHRIGAFLVRRDGDHDGIVESFRCGNAWTLREPDRGDIWFEAMNFGHKNAYVNAYIYPAWLRLAEMLEAAGQPGGAEFFRRRAEKLRVAYVEKFLSPTNGWFVSWISEDGEVHDYCHTFVNGMAVAFGIVPPEQGKEILQRVASKAHESGFKNWHLGVPANLLPAKISDLFGPPIPLNGEADGPWWTVESQPTTPEEERAKCGCHLAWIPAELWQKGVCHRDEVEAGQFGLRIGNGTIFPTLSWYYLQGLQTAGLHEEADRIFNAMLGSAEAGLLQTGIVNTAWAGGEYFTWDGIPCGYEGYLPESWNFLVAAFTREPASRQRLLKTQDSRGNFKITKMK